jgi:phytoene dehydrogenase-like protein
MTGLAAGLASGHRVLERGDHPGGICASYEREGFRAGLLITGLMFRDRESPRTLNFVAAVRCPAYGVAAIRREAWGDRE